MFKNIASDGRYNISGKKVAALRIKMGLSQRKLSDKFMLEGMDLNKNAIQMMEAGNRFVTDVELKFFAEFFKVSSDYLLGLTDEEEMR